MDADILNSIRTVDSVTKDFTTTGDYERLVVEEIEQYCGIEVTESLTEGGLHNSKSWGFTYDYYYKNHFKTHFYQEVEEAAASFDHPRILSVGCGYGGHDLMIARRLRGSYNLVAVDLNPALFQAARRRAKQEKLNIHFKPIDLNFVEIPESSFDVIYAIASIHHVLNLENLVENLHRGLSENGRLILLDIIGQRQVLFWKENVEFAAKTVRKMPRRYWPEGLSWWQRGPFLDPYTVVDRYQPPSVQIGMEGIRQEEIEPIINERFQAEKAFHYNAFMRLICTNPHLGMRLDPSNEKDRGYLESLIELDHQCIETGRLRPTELFGVFKRRNLNSAA